MFFELVKVHPITLKHPETGLLFWGLGGDFHGVCQQGGQVLQELMLFLFGFLNLSG